MAFGNKSQGQGNTEFIGVRGCHISTTKKGGDMVSLFLSKEDLEKLSAKIGEKATDAGVAIKVLLNDDPKTGKKRASLIVDTAETKPGGSFSGGGAAAPAAPKSFAYKPKSVV